LVHHRDLRPMWICEPFVRGDPNRRHRRPGAGTETRPRPAGLPGDDRGHPRQLPVRHARRHAAVSVGAAQTAADIVARRIAPRKPKIAIVLGSGLGFLADRVEGAVRVPYADIPAFPEPGVAGHKGELVAGTLKGVPVLVQAGRFHLYEGHDAVTAGLPVRVFGRLGIRTLIVTNASGGIKRGFGAGTLMLISDHLNLMFRNPLIGPSVDGEERFPDLTEAYDAGLRKIARET